MKSFYELEEELQMGHYKVVGVPVEINGHILVPSSSIADIEEDYEYIKNFRRQR